MISFWRQSPAGISRSAGRSPVTMMILMGAMLLSLSRRSSLGFAFTTTPASLRRGSCSSATSSTPTVSGFAIDSTSTGSGVAPLSRKVSSSPQGWDSPFRTARTRLPTIMATPLPDSSKTPPSEPEPRQDLVYGETTQRSFVKALTWRLTAGVVTLVSGLVFSGSLSTAMSIVGSDFITKSGFMFVGERLWNKVKWGQGKSGDSAKRSLAKAVLWRVFAASNTLICGVFLARDLSVASKIAGTDTVFKTGLFFLNERMWNNIQWGKQFEPEYFI